MATQLPTVSILLPVRNEAKFVRKLLEQILMQDYPVELTEIIVCDGLSDDGTREIVAEMQKEHPHIRLIDNPQRIVPTGLNAGMAASRGEIIIRIDGHAEIARDFVTENVRILQSRPEVWGCGGNCIHLGTNDFARAAAVAMTSRIGVGNASHRFADYEGYGEGAIFPAFRRWVFSKVGNYDESLVRNQDDELNFRVTQGGGKIYISPRVKSMYYVRDSIKGLFRQYFQYSYWRLPIIRKHKRPTTLRQVVPPLFYLLMLGLAIAGGAVGSILLAVLLPAIYLAVLVGAGIAALPRHGVRVAMRVPVALATLQLAYALGWIYGLWSLIFRPDAWNTQGSMAKLSR